MEPNEMMVNEEVVETATEATEEIVKKSSGKGFKIAAGVGLAIVLGGLAIKLTVSLKKWLMTTPSREPMRRILRSN